MQSLLIPLYLTLYLWQSPIFKVTLSNLRKQDCSSSPPCLIGWSPPLLPSTLMADQLSLRDLLLRDEGIGLGVERETREAVMPCRSVRDEGIPPFRTPAPA